MTNKRTYFRILFSLFICHAVPVLPVHSQEIQNIVEGSVSYISGRNIYVKFEKTSGIIDGDTLFIRKNDTLIPALAVLYHSSISCLCKPIGELSFKVSDKISAKIKILRTRIENEVRPAAIREKDVAEEAITIASKGTDKIKGPDNRTVSGRLSMSSYSNFSNNSPDIHRLRYTLSASTENKNSKLSAETYISFSHRLNEWNLVKENLNNALKIYSLSLNYKFSNSFSLSVGRKINPKMANAGAIDGAQIEFTSGNIFAGAVAGTRPDYADYGLNLDLFEYGAYIGQSSNARNGFIQTSLAFLEQQNKSKTDRRFAYFQHSNSAIKNLNIFSSFELDLFKLENGVPKNSMSLTGMYFSVRYRFSSKMSLLGSYDNRKNVIYYETFRNYVDEIAQTASRQGIRLSLNYRPLNFLNASINGGIRFGKDDPRPTKNVNGILSWTDVPSIHATFSLSANLMQTAYLNGNMYGVQLVKDFYRGKFQTTFNYRYVDFTYISSLSKLIQHIGEIDMNFQANKKLSLSVNLETTFQDKQYFNRLYLNVRRKF